MADENETPESKLDRLLASWEKKPDESNKELLAELSDVKKQLKEVRETQHAHDKVLEAGAYKEDIKPTIATIGGETNASNRTVHDWLNGEADENPKLKDAWDDREKNPEVFDKMIEDLKPKFKEHIEAESRKVLDIKVDDTGETDEQKANKSAAHASRIVRNEHKPESDAFDKIDWPALGDNEFARESEKVFEAMRNGELKPEPRA